MNRVGNLAFGAAVVAALLLPSRSVFWACVFFFEMSRPGMYAYGIAGWIIATVGPLALSLYCWSLVKRVRFRWAPHFAFIPIAIALFRGGDDLLHYANDDYGGDSPVGYALLWAILFLSLTVLIHAAALIVECVRMLLGRLRAAPGN